MTEKKEREIYRWLKEFYDEYLTFNCIRYHLKIVNGECKFYFIYPAMSFVVTISVKSLESETDKVHFFRYLQSEMEICLTDYYFTARA